MPREAAGPRVSDMAVGIEGPRPYSTAGNLPADAVASVYSVHGSNDARRYVSDAPYEVPYAERDLCIGTRKDGSACHAKQSPGHLLCAAHIDQE
jgi:hypothetical protein